MMTNSDDRQCVQILVIALIFTTLGLIGRARAAVTLEAKTTDTETHTNTPSSGTGVTVTSTVLDHKVTGLPTLAATASVSGATSFASAAVSDSIVSGLAKKTVSPIVLNKPGFPTGKTTGFADPTGAVTMQVVPTSGNPTQNVILQFAFPTPGSPDVDPITPSSDLTAFLQGAAPPSQEVVRSNANLSPTQIGSTYDATLTAFVSVSQAATGLNEVLFNGAAVFHADSTVDFSGDFAAYNVKSETTADPVNPNLLRTILTDLPIIPFSVKGSTDFDLTVDLTMSIGDPNGPDFTLGSTLTGTAGAAALFTAGATALDRSSFNLVTTPEPGSLTLAALGALALAGCSWRKRRRPT